jgi:CRP/FNR family cyclic AMP-dependent transcriptional regulator
LDVISYFKEARTLNVPAGVIVFREGEPGKDMYVLLQGIAEVTIGGDVVELAKPGSLLGEIALIDSSARSATVITASACRFVTVDSRQFDLLVRESPEFARHVMAVMAARLRRMNERLKEAISEVGVHGRRPR